MRTSIYGKSIATLIVVFFIVAAQPSLSATAELIIDLDSREVLHAERALQPMHPASLTKLMTLYLLFEAIQEQRIREADEILMSKTAAAQAPVKLGVRQGKKVTVKDAIGALIIVSANDVAVAVAEALGGTHDSFIMTMNERARSLGMQGTIFRNASGLPDPAQVTTAHDMALLAAKLYEHFPTQMMRFAERGFEFNGRRIGTHNNFLRTFNGAVGLKTGFTCNAGYNLVATASRDGRRLVGVVLGSPTAGTRDSRMTKVMSASYRSTRAPLMTFEALGDDANQGHGASVKNTMIATECINPKRTRRYLTVKRWSIQLGLEGKRGVALERAEAFIGKHRKLLKGGQPLLIPRWARDVIYQVSITDLSKEDATNTCLTIRDDEYCIVRPPAAAKHEVGRALRTIKALEKKGLIVP